MIAQGENPFLKRMDKSVARARAESVYKAYEAERRLCDAGCYLDVLYAYGSGWAEMNWNREDLRYEIGQLPERIYDANSDDLYISVNRISEEVDRKHAAIGFPDKLPVDIEPATNDPEEYNASAVAVAVLDSVLRTCNFRGRFDEASLVRIVAGSSFLLLRRRRTRRAQQARDEDGALVYIEGDPARPLMVPGIVIEPVVLWPNQIVIDPANTVRDLSQHEILTVVQPLTFDQVQAIYGIDLNDKKWAKRIKATTIGELRRFQDAVSAVTDRFFVSSAESSKTPAIILCQSFFRDPDGSDNWPLMAAWTPQINGDDGVLYYGENPLGVRPLFRLDYKVLAGFFLAQSLPRTLMPHQNTLNVMWTQALRITGMVPKVTAESGTLDDNARNAVTSNLVEDIVEWHRQSQASTGPNRLPAPTPPQMLTELMAAVPGLMNSAAHSENITRGVHPINRELSASAMGLLARRADAPMEKIVARDEMEMRDMFSAICVAAGLNMPHYQLEEMVGRQFAEEAINDYKASCAGNRGLDMRVERNSLMTKTRADRQELFLQLQQGGQLGDPGSRRIFGQLTGIWIDETERQAVQKARNENRMIAAGLPLGAPGMYEPHEIMIAVHMELYMSDGFRQRHADRWGVLDERIKLREDLALQLAAKRAVLPQIFVARAAMMMGLNPPALTGGGQAPARRPMPDNRTAGGAETGAEAEYAGGTPPPAAERPANVAEPITAPM